MVRDPSAEATHTTCPAHYAGSGPCSQGGFSSEEHSQRKQGLQVAPPTDTAPRCGCRWPPPGVGLHPPRPALGDVWQRLLLFWWPRLGQGLLLASSG